LKTRCKTVWATESNRILRGRISPILLATGQPGISSQGIYDIIHNHATDIIQPELQWIGRHHAGAWVAAMAKPCNMPVIPHGASVYIITFVMANTNSPYAEYLSVGKGDAIQPIFAVLEGEPLPVNGKVTLDPGQTRLWRGTQASELLVPFKVEHETAGNIWTSAADDFLPPHPASPPPATASAPLPSTGVFQRRSILGPSVDRGFLQTANNARLKFAFMWAGHDWLDMIYF